jgi:hypothetical protein
MEINEKQLDPFLGFAQIRPLTEAKQKGEDFYFQNRRTNSGVIKNGDG